MKIIFTLTALFLAASTFGQSTHLSYGQAHLGNLVTSDQVDTYTFDATTGDRIYIRMRDAESPVDACFVLLNGSGTVIIEECGNGGIVSLKNYTVEETGTFTILARDVNQNDTGKYGISVNLLNSPSYAQSIDCGYDGENELTVTTEVKSYTFNANAGDVLKARMRGESGSFEAEMEVYDAEGNQLVADYGSGLSQIENLVLPTTGNYTILANDRNGNDLGVFGISIQLVNRMDCAAPIACGDNLTGSINTIAGMTAYSFNVGGITPMITQAKSLNTSFETQLQIYNSAGQLIRTTEGTSSLQNISATLAAGNYLMIAMDRGGNDKAEYGVAMQYLGRENCAEEVICYYNSATDNLGTLAAMKVYSFNANNADVVTAEAGALVDHLDPQVLLCDGDGNILAEDYSFSTTTLENINLETAGECFVIVRDWNGNDLGDYKFSLTSETIFTNTLPVPDQEELAAITADCEVELTAPTATDPCEGALTATTTDPMHYDEQGSYTVTWTFESSQGGKLTQEQIVIIEDNSAPIIDCAENLTFQLSANGEFNLEESHVIEMVYDKCSDVAWIELEQSHFDCSMIGENVVTLWTADEAGNQTSCQLVVNIVGDECSNSDCGDLPDNWTLTDIGNPSIDGSVCYDISGPTFEVTGKGADIFGQADEFTFVYQEICGSSVIQARVTGLSSDASFAFGGIMMRKDNKEGSKYAALLASPEHGVFYQTRLKKDDYTLYEAHEGETPVWIKLERIDKMISGYISTDAVEWELACEIEVGLGNCYEIGLAVSAYSDVQSNTAIFEEVEIYNVGGFAATNRTNRTPSSLATADPCQFEINERDEVADCVNHDEPVPTISVFPNPTADWVNIDGSEFKGGAVNITISDKQGNIYFHKRFDQAPVNLQLDIKALQLRNGYYSVIIDNGIVSASQRFLVMNEG